MRKLLIFLAAVFCVSLSNAQEMLHKDTMLIDVPTAEALEHYSMEMNTRFYSANSVMTSVDFGVYPRLNIGASIAAQNLIGNETPVRVLNPQFQVKFKIYDGSLYLPAIAVGYDGRGYFYDPVDKKYLQEKKGGYVVFSREVFIPNLQLHPGINISDFDASDVYFFTGFNFNIEDKLNLLAEWDNVRRINTSRMNFGARLYLSPSFVLDLALRDVAHKDTFERIIQLRYTVNF